MSDYIDSVKELKELEPGSYLIESYGESGMVVLITKDEFQDSEGTFYPEDIIGQTRYIVRTSDAGGEGEDNNDSWGRLPTFTQEELDGGVLEKYLAEQDMRYIERENSICKEFTNAQGDFDWDRAAEAYGFDYIEAHFGPKPE